MTDKTIRVTPSIWQAAKVAAAEQGLPLKAYADAALEARRTQHLRQKKASEAVTPVEFVSAVEGVL